MQPFFLFRDTKPIEVRVDRFPDAPRAFTTVNAHTTGWSGTIEIHASIIDEPGENDWFIAHSQVLEGEPGLRQNFVHNLIGRFIWMKAVAISASPHGRVDRITAI